MRAYELMMITNPALLADEKDSLFAEIKDELTTHGFKITAEGVWGEKDLAYKINRSEVGFYTLFQLEGDGKAIKEVTKDLNFKKDIWRFMFVNCED